MSKIVWYHNNLQMSPCMDEELDSDLMGAEYNLYADDLIWFP